MVKHMIIQIVQARCPISAKYTSTHLKSTFQKLFSSQTDFWWKSMFSSPSAVWILRWRESDCAVMICYWFFKTGIICQRRHVPCSTVAFKNRVGLGYACRRLHLFEEICLESTRKNHPLQTFGFKYVPLVMENEHPIPQLLAVVLRQLVELED